MYLLMHLHLLRIFTFVTILENKFFNNEDHFSKMQNYIGTQLYLHEYG